ncbi:TOMM precursor leader peptide-binding protein [Thermoactinomyces sp. CICC 10523]|uniref:TOMM precursor leader peptide-binding protein n=1 Tax=Thermoactinomyces sp. CICC 10523 TaxID=2767428 RepID=UPI0018DC248D|nr:TOMM precursor leader peptide-binding protein [Thermoactinomyces sp. CICC 10523]MBH8597267.1 TOMM precursor leader peptide-binding protein [Thermoactinomyces sp. CICC 10523]
MSAVVLVVGDGLLADMVCEEISPQYRVVRRSNLTTGVPETAEMALMLHDSWDPSVYAVAEEVFSSAGISWLRGFAFFGEGVVGPLVRPGVPGCTRCADARRMMARTDRAEMLELQQRLADIGGLKRDAWASRSALLQMVHVLTEETHRVLQGKESHLQEHLYLLNLRTLQSSRHFFHPDPLCPVCSRLPDDSPAAARLSLKPNPKISADSYRCRSLDDLKECLARDYLDHRTGLFNGKMIDSVTPFAVVGVNMPLLRGDETSAGRTHSYAESEMTAILESLERYCGITPRGKRMTVHDSYRNLESQALNPLKVGVHAPEQYEELIFPFKPFDPDRSMDWVWGYSFTEERPILVPKLLAYYSLGFEDGFVYETSNGCAVGGSLEEAIFYGILEVVERDSFLITWYAQLPLPRLDPYSAEDRELRLMVDRIRAVAGYDVHLFNATMEHGIPGVWALAKNRKPKGMNLLCAAGAHPDPVRAAKSAIHELAGMMLNLDEKLEANRDKCMRMYRDPYLVQQMEDHSLLYGLPEAEERLRFLLDENRPLRTFAEEFQREEWYPDLTDDLKRIIKKLRRVNLDVIVVDQTTPELRRNGLFCVKVLIPGMLPITFGHHLVRLTGLDRVLQVPAELGYAKRRLTPDQLNPHPHPFP